MITTVRPARLAGTGSAFLLLLCLHGCGDSGQANEKDPSLLQIERRDLQITVKENAELQALRETVVRSEVEGQATIIFLVEEGKVVQQGEKLVELDASDLVDKQRNQAITVAKASAGLAQAKKELEILQKELTAKRNTAQSNLRIAEMELEKFLGREPHAEAESQAANSDMVLRLRELVSAPAAPTPDATEANKTEAAAPVDAADTRVDPRRYAPLIDKLGQLLVDADGRPAVDRDMGEMANMVLQQVDKIRLAIADLKFQENYYGHSKSLAAKKFITPNELEKDQIEFQRRQSQVGLAWNDLDLLISYELQKQRIKLIQDVENARLELERVIASNEAEVTKAESNMQSSQAEFDLAKERLDNLERQIKNAIVYAPTPGFVIYARQERGRMSSEAVREGIQVRERQDLLVLPDTSKMQAVVKVQESAVAQVRVGQRAHVGLEAFPDRVFTGVVTRVAQQADSNNGWMNSDRKVYTTIVDLDGDNRDGVLKPRAAAAVTILVDQLHGVLAVPLQAVRRDRSVNYVWKQSAKGPVATPIEIGPHNSEYVVVTAGIVEKDTVFLVVPAGVQPPSLPQPAVPMPDLAPTPTPKDGAAPGSGRPDDSANGTDAPGDRGGRRNRGGGNGGNGQGGNGQGGGMPNMTDEQRAQFDEMRKLSGEVRAFLLKKFPARKDEIEDRRAMNTMLDEEPVKQALTELGETWTKYDQMRQQMRAMMGNRGGGGGNRGGGDGGDRNGGDRGNRGGGNR